MKLEHGFTVPVPRHAAWTLLLDVEAVAPCLPGATVESFDGETITGKIRIKLGPVQFAYHGTARFTETDEPAGRAVIQATAKEARGSGTAEATVTTTLTQSGGETQVSVITDLNLTGKPAQFGRGILDEVAGRLMKQFAASLAERLRDGDAASPSSAQSQSSKARPPSGHQAQAPPVRLLKMAGMPVAKRLAPLVGIMIVLIASAAWLIARFAR